MSMENYNFDQEYASANLGNMLALHEYPFSMVDHVCLGDFCCTLVIVQLTYKTLLSNMIWLYFSCLMSSFFFIMVKCHLLLLYCVVEWHGGKVQDREREEGRPVHKNGPINGHSHH